MRCVMLIVTFAAMSVFGAAEDQKTIAVAGSANAPLEEDGLGQ